MEAIVTKRAPLAEDVRDVAWRFLVGAGAGAIAGAVVGGVAGRLAMLVLRLTSPEAVVGLTSDDGFEIGVFTADTLGLVAGMTMAGGVNGVLYVAVRESIPRRWRLPAWSLLGATVVGAAVVHTDGVDFTVLEPAVLAVTLFVTLPAVAAGCVVFLVERWCDAAPFSRRPLSIGLGIAAIAATFALVVGGVVGCAALAGRRTGASRRLRTVARVVVPGGIMGVSVLAAIDLVRDASALL